LYSQYGSNFVLTMLRLMNERDELKVVADQIGAPTWAGTLAHAIWTMVGMPQLSGIYHWSDAGVASWYDFAVAIQEEGIRLNLLDRPIPVMPIRTEEYPTPAERPSYSVLDCTASRSTIGIDALQWRVALRRMLDVMTVDA
jgi:dTDP-4-dehydrorhamnose reductase